MGDPVLVAAILDAAPAPVFVLDRAFRLLYANPALCRLLRQDGGSALRGRALLALVPALADTAFVPQVETAFAGQAVAFELHHARSQRWFAVTATPLDGGESVVVHAIEFTEHHRRASELTAAKARLDAIIDGSPGLVLAVDQDLRILAFNRAYADEVSQLYGRSIAVGMTMQDVLADHAEAQAEAIARWRRAAVDGEEFTLLRELAVPGGETRVYEIRYGNLRHADGTLSGAVSTMHDVTDRVRSRNALAELSARLDAVIRYSPDRVVAVDAALRVVAMNEHATADFVALWGVPLVVGDSLREKLAALPGAQRDRAIAMWERAVAGTAVNHLAAFGTPPAMHPAYEISFGALRDDHGRPAGAVMVAKDVSDREIALLALRESEARFRALGDAAPIGIFLADAHGRCTYANPCFQQIWELREATLLAEGIASRVHPEDTALVNQWLGRAGDSHDFRGEFRLVMADGLERWVLAHSAAIRDEHGTVNGYVGTIDDITDARRDGEAQRQLEQKMLHAQKLESLEVLAGGIAHDFNNLLVGVLGNASLALLDIARDSPAHGPITDIERAAERASDLTRQMLAYSGRGQFVVEPVELSDIVAEMVVLLRTVIVRGAVLETDLAPTLPFIEADATQLRQVVMNLITNASDAIGDRGGRIRVRTGRQQVTGLTGPVTYPGDALTPGDYVFVEVADSGEGMSAETLPRIFEPFFTTKFTGRGLGLAATLGIVRGHHGGICIDSTLGTGTTIRVLLPATTMLQATAVPPGSPSTLSHTGSVLVIDDDETVRVVARRLLERRGFTVVAAEDGQRGITQFRETVPRFTLVLLDLTMPGLDGTATLHALRHLDPDVRVLISSAYRERDVSAHFVGIQPAGFVQKPFRAEELYAAVGRALRA